MTRFRATAPRARRARLISTAALALSVASATACAARPAGAVSGASRADAARPAAAGPGSIQNGPGNVQKSVTWGTCPPDQKGATRNPQQKCGTVKVPLDYRHPAGPAITVEISELATAKPGKKRGYLLLNPGGPALEGLDMPSTMAPTLPASVRDSYDLIGFDPRGVGVSTPMSCGLSPDSSGFPYPAADGSISQNIAQARTEARACAAIGDKLQYFTTANTARDMDRIRQALDAPKISYWGQSYGTYLGAVYTSLFPQRTDRMVLEGDIDPGKAWQQQIQLWNQGMDARFPDAARIAAADSATLGLGGTTAQVTSRFIALAGRLDQTPVSIPGAGVSLNGALLREVTYELLLHNSTLPTLTRFWKAAADLSAGTALTAADATAVQQALADMASPGSAGVPADNQATMTLALICGDASWSRNVNSYAAATAAARARYPLSAGMPDNIWPCAFWSKTPAEPPVTVTSSGPRDILILQNRRDNATPWEGALGMARALGRRAGFVGADNGGHYVYGTGSACADRATVAFLTSGTLPARPLSCPGPR